MILRGLSLAVATLFAAPLAYLALRNAAHLDAFVEAVSSRRALEALARTLLLAGTVSAATAVLGTGAAWLVVRTDVPARRLWRVLLPLPLVIPSFIGAFALVAAFSPGGLLDVLGTGRVEGFLAAFAVLTLLSYPYVYLPVAARLGRLPGSVEESARLLGRRGPATFVSVVLPQLRGAIAAGALLVFLYVVSDFGAVQLLRYDTLTRTIYATRVFDRETSLALCLELGLLALLVVALERAFAPGRHVEASRGRPLALRLGRWRLPALGGLALLVALALAAPVTVLAGWAWRGLTSGSERPGAIASDLSRVVEPALNTAGVSVAAALAAVAVVLPVAVLSVRRRGPVPSLASAVIVGGFALPGLATALALVYWTLAAPWPVGAAYQTVGLLVFAYVVHFGAQSLRTAEVAVGGVPSQLEDAARGLGARRVRRWLRVELPLMAPGLAAGGGLVLLSAMKELPATLLLAPPGFQTLATTIWTSTEDAFLADASIAALTLIALSGVLTWLLLVRRPLE